MRNGVKIESDVCSRDNFESNWKPTCVIMEKVFLARLIQLALILSWIIILI